MGLGVWFLTSCSDPADPPVTPAPHDLPRWSTAPHVQWRDLSAPVQLPLAVIVDEPGGPMDKIVADVDVTTFLNDRFHPLFLTPESGPDLPSPSTLFLDIQGCLLAPVLSGEITPTAWIERGNQAILTSTSGQHFTQTLGAPTRWEGLAPAPDHPLWARCPTAVRQRAGVDDD